MTKPLKLFDFLLREALGVSGGILSSGLPPASASIPTFCVPVGQWADLKPLNDREYFGIRDADFQRLDVCIGR